MITKAQAQYLKYLFECMESGSDSTNKGLAKQLGVSSPSASDMVKKLRAEGYLKDKNLELTQKGLDIAAMLVSKHRLWETFLIKTLNYGWEDVHEDASKLDAVSSEMLYEKLNDYLGEPKICPHGKPIYMNNFVDYKSGEIALADAKIDVEYSIAVVKDDRALLNYLNEKGLGLGSIIKILSIDDYDKSLVISYEDKKITIGERPSENIWLKKKS